MKVGIFTQNDVVATFVEQVRTAAEQGFTSLWTPQIFGVDALTAIAAAGAQVPSMRLGTAVIPVHPRHPQALAQQALTTQQIIGGELVLGIGLSHQVVIEGMWGMSFDKPFSYMREYLDILNSLLASGGANASGEFLTTRAQISVSADTTPAVMLAALGPRMLKLCGAATAGTITWMTGTQTLAGHIVPTITEAADEAGRPAPEVVAAFPVCVTDDVAAARERAAALFGFYGDLPSYRAMLDREGLEGPVDLAIIGSADEVATGLAAVEAAGATTVVASEFGSPDDLAATRELLVSLND